MSLEKTPNKETESKSGITDDTLVILMLESKSSGGEKVFKIHKKRVVIGSVVSADIKLSGNGISPIHAVLEITDEKQAGARTATLYDLASDTGVFVNGVKTVTQVLKQGDKITIGSHVISFSLDDIRTISPRDVFRESAGRRLFLNPREDLTPLLLEDEREVHEIFDFSPVRTQCLEVVMSWKGTILDVQHFYKKKMVVLGTSRRAHFGIPPFLASTKHQIINKQGEQYCLNVDTQMSGVLQKLGTLQTLDKLRSQKAAGVHGYSIPFDDGDFAKISIKDIDFYISFTSSPPRLKLPRTFDRDPLFSKIFISSMLLTAVTLVSLKRAYVPQTLEAEQLPDRIATILYQPEKYTVKREKPKAEPQVKQTAPQEVVEPPKKDVVPKVTKIDIVPKPNAHKHVPAVLTGKNSKESRKQKGSSKSLAPKGGTKAQSQAKEGQGAKAKGPEGKRGSPKSAKGPQPQDKAMRPAPAGGPGTGGGASEAINQGNVDLLKGATTKIQNLLGNSAMGLGKGGEKLKGFGAFTTLGSGGLALSGNGTGGGGDAASLGGLSNKGIGGGRVGTGYGAAGTGTGIVGGKTRIVIRSGGPEEAVVMGAIDADAVEAALLAHRDEFRLCYEREINAETPKLAGRVGTSFVIGSTGRVNQAGIESTSLKNPNVERCVLTVIKRIDFPVPRGGGIVQVTYPFKFSSMPR